MNRRDRSFFDRYGLLFASLSMIAFAVVLLIFGAKYWGLVAIVLAVVIVLMAIFLLFLYITAQKR